MSSGGEDALSKAFPKAVSAIRAASGLAAYDINFYKSLDNTILESSEASSDRLIKLINVIAESSSEQNGEKVSGDSIESSWSRISNLLDTFLERSDIALDMLKNGSKLSESKQSITYLEDNNISTRNTQVPKRAEKPQLLFKTSIDNSEEHPFRPLLTSKPHAIVPFEETFTLTPAEENDPSHYRQPYETEIKEQEYNHKILEKSDPIPSTDWQSTEPIWVDTVDELQKMLSELQKVQEIAVDLEHHDYRSYYGLVCLMQISTRDQDWLIDTLALREDLQVLNAVFADPQVTKVFHGAFMDIIWLQRDLGLYVVSLFDTYHASRQLGFPKHSLAYLLERFASFKTSKKYQLADWRIRPLTAPMKLYARSDTHFLLNIFDQLKNMLIEANKLTTVLFESRNVAKRRFEYSTYRPSGNNQNVVSPIEKAEPWKSLIYQYNLSPSREGIVKSLFDWRDKHARKDDESPRYIMPNQLLVSLAASAPTEASDVLSCSNVISDYVRKNCKEIAELIKKALKDSEEEDLLLMNDLEESKEESGKISFDQVELSEKAFLTQNNKLKTQKSNSLFSKFSKLFKASVLNNSDMSIYSAEGQKIPADVMSDRIKLIHQALPYSYYPEVVSTEYETIAENERGEDASEVTPTQETNSIIPSTEDSKMFDNPEEIVVLKQKKSQRPQQKQKTDSDIKKEAFDYENAEKVMQPSKRHERNVKKRSSSTFDPYSKESEGPKPVKKQPKLQLGKNTSFFSKKKK